MFSDQIGFLPTNCTERHSATNEEAERLDSVVTYGENLWFTPFFLFLMVWSTKP